VAAAPRSAASAQVVRKPLLLSEHLGNTSPLLQLADSCLATAVVYNGSMCHKTFLLCTENAAVVSVKSGRNVFPVRNELNFDVGCYADDSRSFIALCEHFQAHSFIPNFGKLGLKFVSQAS
jgi:hypothetical protein